VIASDGTPKLRKETAEATCGSVRGVTAGAAAVKSAGSGAVGAAGAAAAQSAGSGAVGAAGSAAVQSAVSGAPPAAATPPALPITLLPLAGAFFYAFIF